MHELMESKNPNIRIEGSEEKAKESENAEKREKSLQERSNGM